MIHAKATLPRIFPWNNDRDPEQIDRLQEVGGDLALTQEKLYEIGRNGKLGVRKETPSKTLTLRQFENGDMRLWRDFANIVDPASSGLDESIDVDDLKTKYFDIAAFLTDDSSTFVGTIWLEKLRVNGFSINIADPDAVVERSFDLVGENQKIITSNYLAFQKQTASGATEVVSLSPAPIEWASGDFIFRVLRVRSGVVSELEEGTGTNQWSYATGDVTVRNCVVGDIIKVYYPAATAYTTLWTNNDVSADAVYADQCTIYLKVGVGADTQIYRLQSVGIDVALDRTDYKEIGNKNVVQTGVRTVTTTVTLGRLLENFTLEEVLRGTSSYPYIDTRNFSDQITLTIKIYTDNTKSTFLMGYKITDLSPTALANGATIEEYDTGDNTLESDNFMVTVDESEL